MAVFAIRLSRQRRDISQVEIMGKFAGAVGNYNAHLVAYPDVKWPQIAEDFVKSLGLSFNPYVTQVCFLPFFFEFLAFFSFKENMCGIWFACYDDINL